MNILLSLLLLQNESDSEFLSFSLSIRIPLFLLSILQIHILFLEFQLKAVSNSTLTQDEKSVQRKEQRVSGVPLASWHLAFILSLSLSSSLCLCLLLLRLLLSFSSSLSLSFLPSLASTRVKGAWDGSDTKCTLWAMDHSSLFTKDRDRHFVDQTSRLPRIVTDTVQK